MHPASKVRQAMVRGDAVVDLIPVAHERGAAPDTGIELLRMHGAATRRIGEQSHRVSAAVHLRYMNAAPFATTSACSDSQMDCNSISGLGAA